MSKVRSGRKQMLCSFQIADSQRGLEGCIAPCILKIGGVSLFLELRLACEHLTPVSVMTRLLQMTNSRITVAAFIYKSGRTLLFLFFFHNSLNVARYLLIKISNPSLTQRSSPNFLKYALLSRHLPIR
jgi:hypothetical protein